MGQQQQPVMAVERLGMGVRPKSMDQPPRNDVVGVWGGVDVSFFSCVRASGRQEPGLLAEW